MRFISTLLLICHAGAQDIYDDQTILSIFSGGLMVDVSTIPNLLARVGIRRDPKIASFLSTSHIRTLKNAQCQIVPTSTGSVSHDNLCKYLAESKRYLPQLDVTCGANINGEVTQLDEHLHVNDPNANLETQLDRMNMGDVWELIQQYPRREVTVAVIDHGVDFTDPDMAPLRSEFITSDGRVIDGGWNFVDDSSILTPGSYHGQIVSRVLAARGNNSAGMVGVAPDHVRLVSLQICHGGGCPMAFLVEAIDMAIDLGVDIISMSLRYAISYYPSNRHLLEAVLRVAQDRNIILGSGNEGIDAHDCYPCWYGGPTAMCVAALNNDANYNLAYFSNFGGRVDIAAFGQDIYVGLGVSGNHAYESGTSLATPMVSGAAAILLSLGAEPDMVKRILLADADRFQVAGKPLRPGGGALNILSSVKRVIDMYNLQPINGQRNLRHRSSTVF